MARRDAHEDDERGGCSLTSIAILAILAYAITIGVSFLPGFQDMVEKRLEKELNRELDIERLHLDHRLHVVCRNLAWSRGSDEIEASHIKKLVLRWSLVDSLRAGEFRFDEILVENPVSVVGIPRSHFANDPKGRSMLIAHLGKQYDWLGGTRIVQIRNGIMNWRDPETLGDDAYAVWNDFRLDLRPLPKGDAPRDHVYFLANVENGAEGFPLEEEFFVLPGDSNQTFRVGLIHAFASP